MSIRGRMLADTNEASTEVKTSGNGEMDNRSYIQS